jgi:hypothetical protein
MHRYEYHILPQVREEIRDYRALGTKGKNLLLVTDGSPDRFENAGQRDRAMITGYVFTGRYFYTKFILVNVASVKYLHK